MKSAILKIASSFLAFIVLLSTFSFTIEKHFCAGELASFSLFTSADDCGMDMQKDTKTAKCHQISNKSCCEDELTVLEATNTDAQCVQEHLKFPKIDFIAPLLYALVFHFEEELIEPVPNQKQNLPPITKNRPVLFQTFLL